MRKLADYLARFSELALQIVQHTLCVCCTLLFSYLLLLHTYEGLDRLDLRLACCIENYPLLILMCFSIGAAGAILLDIYEKTDPGGRS